MTEPDPDFVDPITNPDLPWITEPTFEDPVPTHRLADEPETVEAEPAGYYAKGGILRIKYEKEQ